MPFSNDKIEEQKQQHPATNPNYTGGVAGNATSESVAMSSSSTSSPPPYSPAAALQQSSNTPPPPTYQVREVVRTSNYYHKRKTL